MSWWTLRLQRRVFVVVVACGIVTAFVLGVNQVRTTPTIELGDPRVRVEGLVSTVQVTVENTSEDQTYCPVISVAALDREGRELDSSTARPETGDGRLEPGDRLNFVGTLTEITETEYEEEVDDDGYIASVDEKNPCP